MSTPVFAEEAVLSGLMYRNDALHDILPIVSADHFTHPKRAKLFSEIKARVIEGEPADTVSLMEAMPDDATWILDLAANAIFGGMVEAHAKRVRRNWQRREQVRIAQALLAGAKDDAEDSADVAIADLMALGQTDQQHEFTMRQALHAAFLQSEAAYRAGGGLPGITTGLSELDGILGGWHKSDLSIIGARPAMGKTALMLSLAVAAARSGRRVGIVSAEQPYEQIGLRAASMASGVPAQKIRSGEITEEGWPKINQAIRTDGSLPVWIYDRSALTLDELVSVSRKWKHQHDIEILFVDYAQRIRVPGADRITEVSDVARGLKNLARSLDVPVVSLAQVVKGVDQRQDKRPTAGDLANSDELTREADQILMLYRDEVYNRDSQQRGIAEILIEKNRHGPTGFKQAAFHAETMRFADLSSESWRAVA